MKDEMIKIRLTSEEKVAIQKIAEEKNITVSKLILESVFNKSETVARPIEPLLLSVCTYKGLKFKFTLEQGDGEYQVIGRVYDNVGKAILNASYIFGRSAKDIGIYTDEFKATVMAERFIQMLESNGDNPYREYMEA